MYRCIYTSTRVHTHNYRDYNRKSYYPAYLWHGITRRAWLQPTYIPCSIRQSVFEPWQGDGANSLDDVDLQWVALKAQYCPPPQASLQGDKAKLAKGIPIAKPRPEQDISADLSTDVVFSWPWPSASAPPDKPAVSSLEKDPRTPESSVSAPSTEAAANQIVNREGMMLCHCCDHTRYPGHRWCQVHKRVYDGLVKDSISKKKSNPELYKSEMAARTRSMKDPVLSAQKLLQFEHEHPCLGKGRKRGIFDHILLYEKHAQKTYSKDDSGAKWMDVIEYSRQMERKRGWPVGQSRAKWNWWLQQPGIKTDIRGEATGFEQRILLPKGDDAAVSTPSAEEKAIEVAGRRAKAILAEAFKESVDNLGAGHPGVLSDVHSGSLAGPSAMPSVSTCTAFTKAGTLEGLIELANKAFVTNNAKAELEQAYRELAAAGPAPGTAHRDQLSEPGSKRDVGPPDIATQRLPGVRKWYAGADALRRKHTSCFVNGELQLNADRVCTTHRYIICVCMCMCM